MAWEKSEKVLLCYSRRQLKIPNPIKELKYSTCMMNVTNSLNKFQKIYPSLIKWTFIQATKQEKYDKGEVP